MTSLLIDRLATTSSDSGDDDVSMPSMMSVDDGAMSVDDGAMSVDDGAMSGDDGDTEDNSEEVDEWPRERPRLLVGAHKLLQYLLGNCLRAAIGRDPYAVVGRTCLHKREALRCKLRHQGQEPHEELQDTLCPRRRRPPIAGRRRRRFSPC